MAVVEIAERTWRIESLFGPRHLFQYLIAGDEGALLVDAGTNETPRKAILPALRHVRVPVESVRFVVVTHPDLDHQGGLAGLKEQLPRVLAACGFADRALVSEPDRLVADRYARYETEHGVGYSEAEKATFRELAGSPLALDVTLRRRRGGRSRRPAPLDAARTGPLGRPSRCARGGHRAALHLGRRALALLPGRGREITAFLDESRAFVGALDDALRERLESPASLRGLCEHVDMRLGPFGADPVNLMFAVHGHLRRILRQGEARLLDPTDRPARFAA